MVTFIPSSAKLIEFENRGNTNKEIPFIYIAFDIHRWKN
jgi:hypothetical protein